MSIANIAESLIFAKDNLKRKEMQLFEIDEKYWAITQINKHLSNADERLKAIDDWPIDRLKPYILSTLDDLRMDKGYAIGLIEEKHLQEFYTAQIERMIVELEKLL